MISRQIKKLFTENACKDILESELKIIKEDLVLLYYENNKHTPNVLIKTN